jgi:hypothetical protein
MSGMRSALFAFSQASIQKQWSVFNSHSSGMWDTTGNKLQLPGWREIVDWVTNAYHSVQAAEQVCAALHCSAQELYSFLFHVAKEL